MKRGRKLSVAAEAAAGAEAAVVVTVVDAAAMAEAAVGVARAVTAVEAGAAEIAETAGTAGRKAFRIVRRRRFYHLGRRWKTLLKNLLRSWCAFLLLFLLQHLRQKSV